MPFYFLFTLSPLHAFTAATDTLLFFRLLFVIGIIVHVRKHLEKSISDERHTWQESCTDRAQIIFGRILPEIIFGRILPEIISGRILPKILDVICFLQIPTVATARDNLWQKSAKDYLWQNSAKDYLWQNSARVELGKHGRLLLFFFEDSCHTHARPT